MPKNQPDLRIDRPYDLNLRRGAATSVGSGGGGGGGSVTYTAGTAITIDGANAISVKLESDGAIVVGGSGGLAVAVGAGIQIDTNALAVDLATDAGLEVSSGLRVKLNATASGLQRDSAGLALADGIAGDGLTITAKVLAVGAGNGIAVAANSVAVKLKTTSGLEVDSNGLALADSVAGAGLTVASKVLAVGAGDGIDVFTDTVAVDVTDIIDTLAGLQEDASNNIQIKRDTDSGLTFALAGGLKLGTPGTLAWNSTSNVTGVNHNHAITTSSNVGNPQAQAILASTGAGSLTLGALTLYGNLAFAGADRSITASAKLTLAPTGDLLLDPTGFVLLPNAQELKTETFSDLVTGIAGLRLWDRGSNYRQLTVGAIKADELFVRVFVADEVRIDRGEEYWSKSYGVVETDFTMPADEATVDVWFENAPALAAANLFSTNDWLLARTIDWGTGLVVQKIWFQVVSLLTAGSVDNYRQQWRIRRKSGGTTGQVVKKGNTFLDAGQVGQGWIHLSALDQDGGPFIQIGEYTSVSGDVPQFTNYVRIGNLNGTVDYAADTWGQAAGSDLGTTPSAGFSGYTVDATNGLRLFNTSIRLYTAGSLVSALDRVSGLRFAFGATDPFAKWISWQDDPASPSTTSAYLYADRAGGVQNRLHLGATTTANLAHISMLANNAASSNMEFTVSSNQVTLYYQTSGSPQLYWTINNSNRMGLGVSPVSLLHIYEDTNNTGTNAGLTIEQDNTGDAVLQWLLTGGQRWVMGIDNSDGDKLVVSRTATLGTNNILTINPSDSAISVYDHSGNLTMFVAGGRVNIGGVGVSGALLTMQNIPASHYGFQTASDSAGRAWQAYTSDYAFGVGGSVVAFVFDGGTGDVAAKMDAYTDGKGAAGDLLLNSQSGGNVSIGKSAASSKLHVYEDTANTGSNSGVTIEQDGTGDAVIQWLLTNVRRWVMGIDNSATGDPLVIAPTVDLANGVLVLTTGGNLTANGDVTAGGDLVSGDDALVGGDAVVGGYVILGGGAGAYPVDARNALGTHIHLANGNNDSGMYLGSRAATDFMVAGGAARSSSDVYTAKSNYAHVVRGAVGRIELAVNASLTGGSTFTPTVMLSTDNNGILRAGANAQDMSGAQIILASKQTIAVLVDGNLTDSSAPNVVGRYARGGHDSPAAVQNNDLLLGLYGQGYAGATSGFPATPAVAIRMLASETHGTSARGTSIYFDVTTNGSTSRGAVMQIANDGAIYMPLVYDDTVGATNRDLYIESGTGKLGYVSSSLRYKENVETLDEQAASDFVAALRPVRFTYRNDSQHTPQLGLIAEEVAGKGFDELVSYNADGEVETLHYSRFIVTLIMAVQRLQREVADLRAHAH